VFGSQAHPFVLQRYFFHNQEFTLRDRFFGSANLHDPQKEVRDDFLWAFLPASILFVRGQAVGLCYKVEGGFWLCH
jgi:hypothetical protein